jgi:hypothetical protein
LVIVTDWPGREWLRTQDSDAAHSGISMIAE